MSNVFFIGGKGGVGKSTISSALALKFANAGQKSLLISTDPAHNLGDIFGFEKAPNITNIAPNLDILEIDSGLEANAYIKEVAKNTKKFIKSSSYAMMDEYFHAVSHSTNALESALFERLVHCVVDLREKYKNIIIDTAPTGHTLRFFTTPKELLSYLDVLKKQADRGRDIYSSLDARMGVESSFDSSKSADSSMSDNLSYMIDTLKKRANLYERFNEILHSNACTIALVAIPTKLSLDETLRAYHTLEHSSLAPKRIYINMIYPKNAAVLNPFIEKISKTQEVYMDKIEATFSAAEIYKVPLSADELVGIDALLEIAKSL